MLSRIFLLLADDEHRSTRSSSAQDPYVFPQGRIQYPSQVCHHWRSIIIGIPTLWESIDVYQRNLITPVSRLSDDILESIFQLLMTVDHRHNEPSEEIQRIDCIAKDNVRYVSQVCRRWRNSAIGMPMLWANIDIGRPPIPWNFLLIKRSFPVPVNIRCFDALALNTVLTKAPDIVSRIRMFAAWYLDLNSWNMIVGWLQKPNNQLEILSFNQPQREPFGVLPFPPALGTPMACKELYFNDCRPHFRPQIFAHLRSLWLNNSGYLDHDYTREGRRHDISIRITEYELLSALIDMPLLIDLRLEQSFAITPTSLPLPYVRLPQLKKLKIMETFATYSACASFLPHLAVPLTSSINLHFSDTQLDPNLNFILSQVAQRFQASWSGDVTPSLTICISRLLMLSDNPWEAHLYGLQHEMSLSSNSLILEHPVENDWTSYISVIQSQLQPSLRNIMHLNLTSLSNEMSPLLGHFVNVTSIFLMQPSHVAEFLQIAMSPVEAGILFPSLHKILFAPESDPGSFFTLENDSQLLVEFTCWRKKMNSALEIIEFRYTDPLWTRRVSEVEMKILRRTGIRVEEFLNGNRRNMCREILPYTIIEPVIRPENNCRWGQAETPG